MLLWRARGLLPAGVMLLARLEFLREPYYKCNVCCDEDPSLYRRSNRQPRGHFHVFFFAELFPAIL